MNIFLTWFLIGMGSGLIILPIFMWIFNKIRDAKERRMIKREIANGNYLAPIDEKDFDTKNWSEIKPNQERVNNLNKDIFKHEN